MYARSTTVNAQPSSIDSGIAHVRDEVMPAIERIDGCIGLSMMVDRDSGRCIVTSAWRSEDAMQASRENVRSVRDRAAEILGGSAQVDEWEIAVMHRDHRSREGACVRATWIKAEPAQVERFVDAYKMSALPGMEDLDGFCSASLLLDRASGRAVSSLTCDSIEAMERNREQAATLRAAATKRAGVDVLDVREFELVLAHLRVPEAV